MKFQDVKNVFKNVLDIIIDFVVAQKRYFGAGIVFAFIAIILFACTDSAPETNENPMQGVYQKYEESKNKELNKLINSYYTAYAEGDTETLEGIATPISREEYSYISFYSKYIESFDDVEIFIKRGLDENSYIVSAIVDVKLVDIDTKAPGFDFFYVETNEEGKLYINNLYGSFNQSNNVYDMDADVTTLIAAFIQQEDVLEKQAEVQQAYNAALLNDENLNNFFNNTLQDALVQWKVTYEAEIEAEAQAAAEAEAQAAAEAEAASEAEAAAEAEAQEEANSFNGTVTGKINVREKADSSSKKLGQIEKGTTIKIYAKEGDFYKFDYNGTKAYIAAEYVKTGDATEQEPEEEEQPTTTASLEKGTVVTLNATVNIRSKMDSSSSKVAVAYAGEKVTVVMSYAEGWTKVTYGKKEGFIKTDLLTE